MDNNWRDELNGTIRKIRIELFGKDDIKNEAQARVAIATMKEYGDSPAGFIYFEPCTTRSTRRPPDILLCHPKVGLLVIEVKGYYLDDIQSITAGNFLVRQQGFNKPINPFRQAETSLFDIQDAIRRKLRQERLMPLCNFVIALPNISESDWASKGFDRAVPEGQLVFKEHLETTRRLEQRISKITRDTLALTNKKEPLSKDQISVIKEVFGDSAVINEKRPPRNNIEESSLGAYLDEIACLEKYLSKEQQELSRLNVEGYPRLIRGVAGSGKTVVLANLVARYTNRTMSQPEDMFDNTITKPRIAVICFNRALVQFIKQKIKDSFNQQTLTELPQETVMVTHLNNLMYELSKGTSIDYINIKSGGIEISNEERARKYRSQLKSFATQNHEWFKSLQYDVIFIDEGQDLIAEEYQLLLDLVKEDLKTKEKTLIIFYDDAQNLYGRPRPNWKQIGIDVSRGDRAKVMKECFRNTREIVELAFNVLIGSQSDPSLRVKTRTYADINYLKQWDLVEEHGDHIRVKFADRTFSKPKIIKFSSRQEEKSWIATEIARLVEDQHVRPEDILIVFHNPGEFEDLPSIIKSKCNSGLIKGFIRPYGDHNADKDAYIFREGYLTISTTYGAKGYDALVVLIVGADIFDSENRGRASFYVGATRAKMLLYVTGLGKANTLLHEAEKVNEVL